MAGGWTPQGDDPGSDLDRIRKKNAKRDVPQHPDMVPSTSRTVIRDHANELTWFLEVKGLGVIWMKATSDIHDPQGRLKFTGTALLTEDEIRHG